MEYVVREDSIDLLNFSTRVLNRLKSMKMMTIGDYLDYPEDSWITSKTLERKASMSFWRRRNSSCKGDIRFLSWLMGSRLRGK